MYEALKGKKLLILGSDASNMDMIACAHEMGVYVIAVDGITDRSIAPAKQIADEAWDIDYSDLDAIEKKCLESGVNGVFAGYSEFRVLAACRIAKRMGFPFYATEAQINLTRNKRTFKDMCIKHDIPVPKDYCFAYPLSAEEKNHIEFPVIVKPADYAGRKGITVCYSREQLDAAIEYAVSKSQSRTIIVEDYLHGIEFSSIYTIVDGKISLSSVNEKYITKDQEKISGLCEFLISPAKSYGRYIEELDGKLRTFLNSIDAKNAVAFFQGIVTDQKIYVFEMGYRINGNNDYRVIERMNGLNYMKMLIAYSLCGDVCDDISKDNPVFSQYACTLLYYAHEGIVGEYILDNAINHPQVTNVVKNVWQGRKVEEDGSTKQKVLTLKITGHTVEEIVSVVDFCNKNVVVKDIYGTDMLFKRFDPQKLLMS